MHWFLKEMTTEEWVQNLHTVDDLYYWLVLLIG